MDGLTDPLDTLAGAAKEAKVVNLTPRASLEKPVHREGALTAMVQALHEHVPPHLIAAPQ